jgi:murein endopeptidase
MEGLLALLAAVAVAAGPSDPPVHWRASKAIGQPHRGRLRNGVKLPAEGRDFFTFDPALRRTPNRPGRRYATDGVIRTLLAVTLEFRATNPHAPRVGIGDLSRRRGGPLGRRFGGLGHASHQNGLDADVYYPRWDGLERRAYEPGLVDEELAQELVDLFIAAGAEKVFVGPRLDLRGPKGVVVGLPHHDDHLHVRFRRDAQ